MKPYAKKPSQNIVSRPTLHACLFAAALTLCPLSRTQAIEVSLEENKAQRGNIGFVDLQAVFRLYPDTQKAKQNFEEVVRQAEDQVNARKSELMGLRAELARLKMEREFLTKTPFSKETADPLTSLPVPALPGMAGMEPRSAQPLQAPGSTPRTAAAGSDPPPGASMSLSTPSVKMDISTESAQSLSSSTAASGADKIPPQLFNLPGINPEKPTPDASAPSASVAQVDSKIAEKTKSLQSKEDEFKTYQAQVEKNLLDVENRKTEILLGKIYQAVQETARAESVSIVVDKSQILFGQKAVDLTEKVLQRLKKQ